MKTIPVSFVVAGMLLPAFCLAQPPEPPKDVPEEKKEAPPAFLEAWKNADADHDGFISKAEFDAMPRIQKLPEEKRKNLFGRFDKDTDGKLSREELVRFAKNRDGHARMKRLWELDADKSGGISAEEFKAGEVFMKLPPEKREEVFRRLDTDGDGTITPKDKPQAPFKRGDGKPHGEGEPGKDGPDRINRKLDTNGDGALSFEEFRAGPQVKNLTEDEQEDRFELLDRNKDLKISPDDFQPPAPPPGDAPATPPAEMK